MEEITNDNNKVIEDRVDSDESDFSYGIINIPWDDRTKRSKVFVILLLVSIFVATIGTVINNFVTHYKNFIPKEAFSREEINCNLVNVDEYMYAARIYSLSAQELICLGAVIGDHSVLVHRICLNLGSVRIYAGSATDQRCKKGFSVEAVEGVSENLALLTSSKQMSSCSGIINIGSKLDGQTHAFIIGRPFRGERSLSRQLVTLNAPDNFTQYGQLINNLRHNNAICVKHLSRCPVRAGDLLVQRGRLLGLALVKQSANNKMACFANISTIRRKLKQLDDDIRVTN